MSENPYTMNSLGPVWQQGYDAGQAAMQNQLERMPCGHRRCDREMVQDFNGEVIPGACLSCRALQEALRRAREEVLVEAAKANCPICADGEGVHQINAEFYHGTLKCESGSIHLLRSKLEGR